MIGAGKKDSQNEIASGVCSQAGNPVAGRRAGGRAGRQAGRQAGRPAGDQPVSPRADCQGACSTSNAAEFGCGPRGAELPVIANNFLRAVWHQ